MSVLTQPPTMGDVLKYELNPNFTRETVALLAGTDYPAGSVLGRVTASGKWKLATASGSDGAQNAAGVLLYPVDARLIDAIGIVLAGGLATLPLREARELFEREYLLTQINRFGGNISRTASFVGMERSALHRKLKSLGVVTTSKSGGRVAYIDGDVG